MSSVVFILGAGASRSCGAPLMSNFLSTMDDLFRYDQNSGVREHYNRVFKAIGNLQAVHSKAQLNLSNIETVFTALELGRIIERIPGFASEEIPGLIASLKTLMVKTLELTVQFPVERRVIRPPSDYARFAELLLELSQSSNEYAKPSVITFNYDIALDFALVRAGFAVNYVVNEPSNRPQKIDLMKLHGSLNWAGVPGSSDIRVWDSHDYTNHFNVVLEEIKHVNFNMSLHMPDYFQKYHHIEINREPLIVPPTWNKSDYHKELTKVWSAAAKHLSEADYIFVIGYSLPETDAFFRLLYALGSVGDRPIRKFAVCNIEPKEKEGGVYQRFKSLLGLGAEANYDYQERTFEQAIPWIRSVLKK